MFDSGVYMIGQFLGIIAVILGFICFQMKSSRSILTFQIIVASVFSAHYLLIGAHTAMALNLLAAVQCVGYYFRDRRGSKSMDLPIVFTILTFVSGVLTWEGWYSAFIMLGLVINSISLAYSDAQKIRYSMFVKSPACLIYNIIVLSSGGIIYECAVLISAIIATSKEQKKKSQLAIAICDQIPL